MQSLQERVIVRDIGVRRQTEQRLAALVPAQIAARRIEIPRADHGRLRRQFKALDAFEGDLLGTDAFDVSPRALGYFSEQRQFVGGPYVRALVVDRHQGGKTFFLHQRHADGRSDADGLKGRRFMRIQFDQIVVHDQRQSSAQVLDGQLAEVRQAVVSDDVDGAGCRPVASDSEAVLVRIHVGVGATGHPKMLPQHACGDRENGIGIAAFRRLLAEAVEKTQSRLVGVQCRFRPRGQISPCRF